MYYTISTIQYVLNGLIRFSTSKIRCTLGTISILAKNETALQLTVLSSVSCSKAILATFHVEWHLILLFFYIFFFIQSFFCLCKKDHVQCGPSIEWKKKYPNFYLSCIYVFFYMCTFMKSHFTKNKKTVFKIYY